MGVQANALQQQMPCLWCKTWCSLLLLSGCVAQRVSHQSVLARQLYSVQELGWRQTHLSVANDVSHSLVLADLYALLYCAALLQLASQTCTSIANL